MLWNKKAVLFLNVNSDFITISFIIFNMKYRNLINLIIGNCNFILHGILENHHSYPRNEIHVNNFYFGTIQNIVGFCVWITKDWLIG